MGQFDPFPRLELNGRSPTRKRSFAGGLETGTFETCSHVDDAIDRRPSACVSMKIHRHELQHRPILLYAALECGAAFVRGERDRRDRTTGVVHRHCEVAANPELRRLVEQRALRRRQTLHREFLSLLERLGGCQRLDDDRVNPFIVFPQIMIGPLNRVIRDEFRRIAPSRRHRKIGEAAQIERRTRVGEDSTKTLRRLSASPLERLNPIGRAAEGKGRPLPTITD
jgi:hypothetical protein